MPAAVRDQFGDGDSNLARYATRLNCVEVNSSFYRRHRPATWARWAASVPAEFRFAVKVPKAITHEMRLSDCDALMEAFASDTAGLGAKFAVALVQLAPKHEFDPVQADQFFPALARLIPARIVCEPRHASWFSDQADDHLMALGVSRAAADPAVVPQATRPGGALEVSYWRLHGSPAIYRSSYGTDAIAAYAEAIMASSTHVARWCIFDNTASSAATGNALAMAAALGLDQN